MKHQYYCANATGDITGFTEKTGAVSRFTISEYSGGTAAGWGSDGKAEGTEVIELVGFTGTITINEVVEISGTTQRSEVRAITTDSTILGNERISNGDFVSNLGSWTTTNANATNSATWNAGVVDIISDTNTFVFRTTGYDAFLDNIDYSVTIVVTEFTGAAFTVTQGVALIGTISKVGTHTFLYNSGTLTDWALSINAGGAGSFSIDSVSMKEAKTETNYYINGTLQSYMPPLPDPATYIVLDAAAKIGHADTIDYEEDAFKVWTRALDGAEVLEEYNKTPIYLVDDDGNILVDSNDVPLVM